MSSIYAYIHIYICVALTQHHIILIWYTKKLQTLSLLFYLQILFLSSISTAFQIYSKQIHTEILKKIFFSKKEPLNRFHSNSFVADIDSHVLKQFGQFHRLWNSRNMISLAQDITSHHIMYVCMHVVHNKNSTKLRIIDINCCDVLTTGFIWLWKIKFAKYHFKCGNYLTNTNKIKKCKCAVNTIIHCDRGRCCRHLRIASPSPSYRQNTRCFSFHKS